MRTNWTMAAAGVASALILCGMPPAFAQQPTPPAATPAATPQPAAPAPAAAGDAALIARGAYLARAADCMPCHTGDPAKSFAGGLALNTPFGAIYSPNITSDKATGIGNWTYDQFVAAVRDGIRADGAYLYPAMPYDAYTLITDDDMKALWAFVKTIPPVANVPPENQMAFPFNIRMGMLAWRELFFTSVRFKPTEGKSAEWNRGSYLVEALGHCSDCHTPRNIMGATEGRHHFLGAEIDGYWAPAIDTAALKASGWTPDSLATFLKSGSATGKTSVFGPMAEVVHDSLGFMTDPDIKAIVTYLFDSPPPKDKPSPQAISPLPADVHTRAAKLYIDNCIACHQDKGAGMADVVPPLAGNPAVVAAEPYNIIMAVLGGLPAGGSYGPMPSFAGRLSDQQVADLANYVRTSWGNTAAPNVTPQMVATWRATANVPDYGTQAASAFDCPKVGGAPGADGPDPDAVASLSAMMQGGQRSISLLADAYRGTDPNAGPGTIVDALTAAYCPVVARSNAPDWQKYGELKRFTLQVAATLSPRTTRVPVTERPIIWAVPTGASLVVQEPRSLVAKLTCPADDGKEVPKDISAAAAKLLGTPKPPVDGATAGRLASDLLAQNPKAKPADAANGLILAYCAVVAAQPGMSVAEQNALLNGFGQQVIQSLQLQRPRSTVAR